MTLLDVTINNIVTIANTIIVIIVVIVYRRLKRV